MVWVRVTSANERFPKKLRRYSVLALFGLVLCAIPVKYADHERGLQRDALKTTTFKVASVTRKVDNDDNMFVYHVESNKFGVKTITSPMNHTDDATKAVTDENKVKTITLKYGKMDGTSDNRKNLYKVVSKTYG